MRRLLLTILLLAPATLIAEALKVPGFVTSYTCMNCHEQEYTAWSNSHHSWAWRQPTKENVFADFNNAEFRHLEFTYRFQTRGEDYVITADNSDGEQATYPVRYVVGVTPLQQYLVETEKGRLQTLDVSWDTERKRWYHLYPDQDTSSGNGMHWTGSYKNWNTRCAECHATDFHKNYDPQTDSYNSQQAEIGVGCEACHGPGEAHLAWAKQPDTFEAKVWYQIDNKGLTSAYGKEDAASEINLCAGCHSRREPIGSASPPVGADFHDHYRLSPLIDGMYFPDGQIQDEVYVLGSFLQSKMHANGVKCTHCHDAHSYQLKLDGNIICTQCHNSQGNPAFPSLTKSVYDSPVHHFHSNGSEGAACKNCHMPERHYMVVDGRHDHSFRIPRPDLSAQLKTPDPCIQCHQDKNPIWAATEIKKRFPEGQIGKPHFAELFAKARRSFDQPTRQALLELALDQQKPAIIRASALQHLQQLPDVENPQRLVALLKDKSPLVRSAAIDVLSRRRTKRELELIAPLLADSSRSVRLEAAKAFLGIPPESVDKPYKIHLSKAMEEFQHSLVAKADYPENQMVLGGVALAQRNLNAAIGAFQRAVAMDPQLVQAWVMLARIFAVQKDRKALIETLKKAVHHNPDSEELNRRKLEADGLPDN